MDRTQHRVGMEAPMWKCGKHGWGSGHVTDQHVANMGGDRGTSPGGIEPSTTGDAVKIRPKSRIQ